MSDDPIITIQDVRNCGLCVWGARAWFERHGLNFRHFIRHGIRASEVLKTGDGYAQQVVERARRG